MNVCVITVAILMLLRDFGPYGIIFMTVHFTTIDFPIIFDGLFTGIIRIHMKYYKRYDTVKTSFVSN
jgi:hypothetical protein